MRISKRGMHVLLFAAFAALVAAPVALAGADGAGAAKTKGAGAKRQLKVVKKRISQLEAALTNGLAEQSALKGRLAAVEARKDPTALPPSGPAGGVLSGSYPKPQIATGAVGSSEIADGTVGPFDIADDGVGGDEIGFGAVGSSEIADGAVRGGDLGPTIAVEGEPLVLGNGGSGTTTASCPTGSRVLSGGFRWIGKGRVERSFPVGLGFEEELSSAWAVAGLVDQGPNSLIAIALCLEN
jgi:hypothetical protein